MAVQRVGMAEDFLFFFFHFFFKNKKKEKDSNHFTQEVNHNLTFIDFILFLIFYVFLR